MGGQSNGNLLRYGVIGVLVVAVATMMVSAAVLASALRDISTANAVITGTERVLSTVKDVETGYRGFVIVGRESYLEPYRQGLTELNGELSGLEEQGATRPRLAELMPRLRQAIDEKLAFAANVIDKYRNVSPAVAAEQFQTGEGRRRMDVVRGIARSMTDRAAAEIERDHRSRVLPAAIGLALSLLTAIGGAIIALRSATRMRKSAARASQLMADVVGRAPVGVAILNRDGRLVQANPSFCNIAKIDHSAVRGGRLSELAPDMNQALARPIQIAVAGFRSTWQSQPSTPIELKRGDRSLHVTATLFPVELGDAERGAGIVINDITRQRIWEMELEEARDEADAANRAKSAFIANMSHELRTPLTAVLGYSELLEEEILDLGHDSLIGDLKKISMNARHLLNLINDVLDLSKIEAQKMDVNAVDVDVGQMLTEIDAASGVLMDARGNAFVVDSADAPRTMFTDDLKLKQIMLNLIGNAAKFTENGTVTLKVERTQHGKRPFVRFTVSDTGIGMTQEHIARLFERFRQADETTTRKYGGTGLGLALTRGLTILLHGTIDVRSEVGKGTVFTVELPEHHADREMATSEAGAPNTTDQRGAILVVDDDASIRDVVERILVREGFRVITAGDGKEALDKARAFKPAAILLDVMLPVLDGWNVLRTLRSDPATAEIPVIMQTLLDEERFAYAHGANGYLHKPVQRSKLIDTLLGATKTSGQVMIVDDDREARERLVRVLRRDDWAVIEKENGREALDALASITPDLILVDLVMPEMDGHSFIRHVRSNADWARIPIIVLTAEDIGSADIQQLEAITADIVQKGSMPLTDLVANLRQYTHDADDDVPAGRQSSSQAAFTVEK